VAKKRDDLLVKLRQYLRTPSSSLQWYHRVGRCLCTLNAASPYGTCCVRSVASELKHSYGALYRAMKFAEKYTGDQLRELDGLPFAAVKVLLTVKDDSLRQQLQPVATSGKGLATAASVFNHSTACPNRSRPVISGASRCVSRAATGMLGQPQFHKALALQGRHIQAEWLLLPGNGLVGRVHPTQRHIILPR
jgi:hypothetical protein